MKLLIADDEYLIREALAARLKKGNYEFEQIFFAGSGLEAWHIIEEMRPDIVITDVRMEYITGLELIQRCRMQNIQTSFIVVSGFAEFEYMQTALENDVCAYLLKPITQEKLFSAVNKAINKQNESTRLSKALLENEQLNLANLLMKCRQDIISETEYGKLLVYLGAETDFEFLCAAVHVSTYRHDRYASVEDVYRSMEQQLSARMPVLSKILPYKRAQNGFFLLMGTQLNEKETVIHSVWQDIVQRIKNSGAIVSVGLSKPEKVIDSGFMLSAEKALNQRYERGIGSVYSCRAIRESADIAQILDVPSFADRVKGKEGEEAAAEFEKLVVKLYPHIYNLDFLFQYLYDLMIELGFNPNKQFWKDYIEKKSWTYCANLSEILKSIREELEKSCHRIHAEGHPLSERVKLFIREHYREDLSLSILANQFHLNPRYFASIFKKDEGLSPTDYLTQVRIEAACRELETTDVPASEISVMIGYDDPRYFYKVFKKKLGVTPKEYRQKQL